MIMRMREVRRDDRRYDEAAADHARAVLRRFVDGFSNQTEAGRKLGVHQTTLGRALDPFNQPSLRVLIQLSRVTGTSLDRILGLDLDAPPKDSAPVLTPSPPPTEVK